MNKIPHSSLCAEALWGRRAIGLRGRHQNRTLTKQCSARDGKVKGVFVEKPGGVRATRLSREAACL